MALLDNYEMSTGVAEKVTNEELEENERFLDAILKTEVIKVLLQRKFMCMGYFLYAIYRPWFQKTCHLLNAWTHSFIFQRAHKYLVSKGQASSDIAQFKKQLNDIWFRLYHRDRSGG